MAIGTMAAIGLGAAGVGSFLGSKSQSKAAKTAANTQQQVANQNNALAQGIYNQNQQTLAPYVQAGVPAVGAMNSMLGLGDPAQGQNAFRQFMQNSDYGFQFGEGSNQINSGHAGAGTLQSGAAMKDLERFRQNLQSGYRGQFMNALGNQQGLGMGAASAQAGVGQNYVNTVSANNQNAGDAAANAALVRGANNPLANTLSMLGGGLFGMAK